jgi:photosystem II stability/assembly factor-like uncharacterized protein
MVRTIALLLVLALVNPGISTAQVKWKKLANLILQTDRNSAGAPAEYGAICAKGSVVLAGWQNLVRSTDLGKTWTKQTLPFAPYRVTDIDIYDENIFAVATEQHGAYLSVDGGLTWQLLKATRNAHVILFDGASTKLVLLDDQVLYVISVGQSTQTAPMGYNWGMEKAADGSLLSIETSTGDLQRSTNGGKSWINISKVRDKDCFGLIADKFDPNIVVIVNEDSLQHAVGDRDLP